MKVLEDKRDKKARRLKRLVHYSLGWRIAAVMAATLLFMPLEQYLDTYIDKKIHEDDDDR